jgi:hypothetical protein
MWVLLTLPTNKRRNRVFPSSKSREKKNCSHIMYSNLLSCFKELHFMGGSKYGENVKRPGI